MWLLLRQVLRVSGPNKYINLTSNHGIFFLEFYVCQLICHKFMFNKRKYIRNPLGPVVASPVATAPRAAIAQHCRWPASHPRPPPSHTPAWCQVGHGRIAMSSSKKMSSWPLWKGKKRHKTFAFYRLLTCTHASVLGICENFGSE